MYLVRIVGPAGKESYLFRGREVPMDCATRYSSPSAAKRALVEYHPEKFGLYGDVLDENDPERRL